MFTAVLVEDDKNNRDYAIEILKSSHPEINILGEYDNVSESISAISKLKPQLLLLDIDLKDGIAFEILKSIPSYDYRIIFISAHQDYALQAIKFSALDFILKPYSPSELIEAIDKVIDSLKEDQYQKKIEAFFSNFETKSKKLVLKTSDAIHVLGIQDIIRIEADNYYSKVYLADGGDVVVSKTLKEFERLLQGYNFIRVHQSHLINLDKIKYFDKRDSGGIVMVNGDNVPVSSRKKQSIFNIIDKLSI